MEKYSEFFKMVEANVSIVIFGHIFPDGDCYGSSEGLKSALLSFYPDKKIYVVGTDFDSIPTGFPTADEVSDEIISQSLVIVCDLSNKKRIW
jgi:phosphoesterase RecJ-like protein